MTDTLYWIGVVLTTIIASARLTRLAVYDKFPPVMWVRHKFQDATDGSNWQLLAICGYCASFWMTGFVILLGYYADVYGDGTGTPDSPTGFLAWWLVMGTLAASYLAAAFVANDGDSEDED